jgi:hypothetical protein
MATINQSPAGQTSVTVSGIDNDSLGKTSTNPFRQRRNLIASASLSVQMTASGGGGFTIPSSLLLGKSITTSAASAKGVFRPSDQVAAKRDGAWP